MILSEWFDVDGGLLRWKASARDYGSRNWEPSAAASWQGHGRRPADRPVCGTAGTSPPPLNAFQPSSGNLEILK
jgi:hypothetical protein